MKALPLEKQVASLEPMQELEGLGLKVVSYFCWENYHGKWRIIHSAGTIDSLFETLPALTVAELGELLPCDNRILLLGMQEVIGTDSVINPCGFLALLRDPSLLARMLIWFIKEGHVTIEELNK